MSTAFRPKTLGPSAIRLLDMAALNRSPSCCQCPEYTNDGSPPVSTPSEPSSTMPALRQPAFRTRPNISPRSASMQLPDPQPKLSRVTVGMASTSKWRLTKSPRNDRPADSSGCVRKPPIGVTAGKLTRSTLPEAPSRIANFGRWLSVALQQAGRMVCPILRQTRYASKGAPAH
jgi:hypothetical protein